MSGPRPYPYQTWSKVKASDVDFLHRAAHAFDAQAVNRALEGAKQLLAVPLELDWDATEVATAPRELFTQSGPFAAWVLGETRGRATSVIACDASLAMWILDRLSGAAGDDAPRETANLTKVERGMLSFFGARLIESAQKGFFVRGLVTQADAVASVLSSDSGFFTRSARLTSGTRTGRVWFVAPFPTTMPTRAPREPAWLADAMMNLFVDAGRATLDATTIRTLEIGDVLIPNDVWSRPDPSGFEVRCHLEGANTWLLRGTLRASSSGHSSIHITKLNPLAAEHGMLAQNATRTTPQDEPSTMTDVERTDTSIEMAIAQAPLDLSLELARIQLPLEALRSLREGEVLRTGTPLASNVSLRLGTRIIASGELVEIDGEVGVRITRLLP